MLRQAAVKAENESVDGVGVERHARILIVGLCHVIRTRARLSPTSEAQVEVTVQPSLPEILQPRIDGLGRADVLEVSLKRLVSDALGQNQRAVKLGAGRSLQELIPFAPGLAPEKQELVLVQLGQDGVQHLLDLLRVQHDDYDSGGALFSQRLVDPAVPAEVRGRGGGDALSDADAVLLLGALLLQFGEQGRGVGRAAVVYYLNVAGTQSLRDVQHHLNEECVLSLKHPNKRRGGFNGRMNLSVCPSVCLCLSVCLFLSTPPPPPPFFSSFFPFFFSFSSFFLSFSFLLLLKTLKTVTILITNVMMIMVVAIPMIVFMN